MYSELQKKPLNMVSKIGHLVWSIFPLKPSFIIISSFGGMFQLTIDFLILPIFFTLRPWPVGKLWWGFEIQGQSSQT